jgi:hypothetical protein
MMLAVDESVLRVVRSVNIIVCQFQADMSFAIEAFAAVVRALLPVQRL